MISEECLEMSSNTFEIRTYGKSEFAMLMFPNARDPQQAQDRLLRWIKRDAALHEQIRRLARSAADNDYCPAQVRLMIEKWGAPGEYEV